MANFSGNLGFGQSQVLGGGRDPLSVYLSNQNQNANLALRRDQMDLQNQRYNEAQVGKLTQHKYVDPGDRFKEWGQQTMNNADASVMQFLQKNPGVDLTDARPFISKVHAGADKDLATAAQVSALYKEKENAATQNKFIDPYKYKTYLNKLINHDSPYDVNQDRLANADTNPGVYDINAIIAYSVKDIKDQFQQQTPGAIQTSPLTNFMEIVDNKKRFKNLDAVTDYVLRGDDVTELGMDQKVKGGLTSDAIRYKIASSLVPDPNDEDAVDAKFKEIQYDKKYAPQVREIVKSTLAQLDKEDRDVHVVQMGKFKQGGASKITPNDYTDRLSNISAILKPFDQKGNITTQARAAIGRLKGGDFGGLKVHDATPQLGGRVFSKGQTDQIYSYLRDNPPWKSGSKEGLEKLIGGMTPEKQAPADHLTLKLKTGTSFGEINKDELPLDLSDPGAKAILNTIFSSNKSEKQIKFPDLLNFEKGQAPTAWDAEPEGGETTEEADNTYLDD